MEAPFGLGQFSGVGANSPEWEPIFHSGDNVNSPEFDKHLRPQGATGAPASPSTGLL